MTDPNSSPERARSVTRRRARATSNTSSAAKSPSPVVPAVTKRSPTARQIFFALFGVAAVATARNYHFPATLVLDLVTRYVPNGMALGAVGVLNAVAPVAPMDYLIETSIPQWVKSVQDRYFDQSPPDMRYIYQDTPATVLNVPWLERIEFFGLRFWNYFALNFANLPYNLWYATFHSQTQVTPDEEFAALFSDQWPSSFIHELDLDNTSKISAGMQAFVASLRLSDDAQRANFYWYYAEFPGMADWAYNHEHDKEFYGAGSYIILRRRKTHSGLLEPVAVELFGRCLEEATENAGNHPTFSKSIVIRPGDNAWDAAKLFVLHGAQHYYVLAEHPLAHFPFDTINAVTKNRRFMPLYHPLPNLLMPHFRFTLTLNDFVMNSFFTSILLNDYLVHCFDASGTQIFMLAQEYSRNFNFNTHKVRPSPADRPSNLTMFLLEYRPIIKEFVQEIVAQNPNQFHDRYVKAWMDEIARYTPGFPTGDEIAPENDVLVETLTEIIFDLSVHHSTQHWNYHTAVEMNKRPWRIRHRPPLSAEEKWDFGKGSQTWGDAFIYAQTEIMFFYAGPYTKLAETHYDFGPEPAKNAIAASFLARLQEKDRELENPASKVPRLAPLSKLGPSIDY